MKAPRLNTRNPISRRHFLRGTGACFISLPFLEAMENPLSKEAQGNVAEPPKRFVAMCATLGFHTPFLFPEKVGRGYELTPYLEKLKDNLDQLTLFSGLSHPDQQGNNGHASELTWLTSAQRPGLAGFRNTISLDQLIAGKIGIKTRFPSLVLSTSGRSMSWTSNGVEIPGMTSPSKLFKALFIDGTSKEIQEEIRKLKRGKSILDSVNGKAKSFGKELGKKDREKLEEYLTAIRDLEKRLQQSEGWVLKPKPKVEAELPKDVTDRHDAIAKQKLMYDMIVLALQTDSTRTITFQLSGMNAVPVIPGVQNDWHNLSHHGKDPKKIEELKIIEEAEFKVFNDFLTKLKNTKEQGKSLLDHTTVLYGSNLGNASSHSAKNLPIILAGGNFKHGSHIAMDQKDNTPFANLFLPIAKHMGVKIDRFGSSTKDSIEGFEVGQS